MRSLLVPLAAGALTIVLVATAALVWALFLRGPQADPASEVVVGESPGVATTEPGDGVGDPPQPLTEEPLDPVEEDSDTTEPSPEPGPSTGFPFDCLDGHTGHEHWDEDTWDDWWEACLDARFEDDDD